MALGNRSNALPAPEAGRDHSKRDRRTAIRRRSQRFQSAYQLAAKPSEAPARQPMNQIYEIIGSLAVGE